ncbi:MAG: hypothetical protein IJ943_00490 [Akkermansia sp.]|nr:hypothetical protein [Akkermansia sp.]
MNWSPGHLSKYFKGVCVKRLSATESDPTVSHGHEFQGVRAFVDLFGKPTDGEKIVLPARFIYLSDEAQHNANGTLTFYDSRWNKPHRAAEYRLYYTDNLVTEAMYTDDCLLIAKDTNDEALVIIAKAESLILSDILWLFGLTQDIKAGRFNYVPAKELDNRELPATFTWLLELLGIPLPSTTDYLAEMHERFGLVFPDTVTFSAFARSKSNYPHALDGSADDVLYDWYNTEEHLFTIFEESIIAKRIEAGFTPKSFIEYALSVLNRRKSRAGQGLENHLSQLFDDHQIRYSRTPVTENKSKPDFLFPGITYYRDSDFPANLLHMLGVKTTCKDRWRQVLVEADRIPNKHLLTLQGAISVNQTSEMQHHNLQLVVPKAIHSSYTPAQQSWLMTVDDFVTNMRNTQFEFMLN